MSIDLTSKLECLRVPVGGVMLRQTSEMPNYMQKGSKGRAVTLLQVFLCGQALGDEIIFDEEYGEMTATHVRTFQTRHELEADGNFGPATRALAKDRYNFDFVQAYGKSKSFAFSTFVQPEGNELMF